MEKDTGIVQIERKDKNGRTITKEYMTVAYRVSQMREDHKHGLGIETEIYSIDPEIVVIKATIKDAEGRILATGHAEENRNSSYINKTSAVENCETSAIGRALASLGYLGTEFCSADELANAIQQQNAIKNTQGQPRTEAKPCNCGKKLYPSGNMNGIHTYRCYVCGYFKEVDGQMVKIEQPN